MGLMDGLNSVGGSAPIDERWRRGFRFFYANDCKTVRVGRSRGRHSEYGSLRDTKQMPRSASVRKPHFNTGNPSKKKGSMPRDRWQAVRGLFLGFLDGSTSLQECHGGHSKVDTCSFRGVRRGERRHGGAGLGRWSPTGWPLRDVYRVRVEVEDESE